MNALSAFMVERFAFDGRGGLMLRARRPVGTVLRLIRFAQTAEDLMTPDPFTISMQATARDAAAILTERGLAAAPVVNGDRRPVGTVSRTDIARSAGRSAASGRAAAEFFEVDELTSWSSSNRITPIVPDVPDRIGVRDVMERRFHAVPGDASAAKVVEELLARKVQRLLVIDDEGRLIGTVGALDVLRNLRR
jgi:CBS domain-containing protein